MNRVRAPNRLRSRLRQTEIAHLTLRDQPRHRADRIFDRRVRIDAMLIIEVDHVGAEPLEARFAGRLNIFRLAAHRTIRRIGGPYDAELGRKYNIMPPIANRITY